MEVAGYSITSSPLTNGRIEIAVKLEGENPVTHLLHTRAKIGDELHIDGGQGEFYYQRGKGDSIVLIGGGIGLTPLISILAYVAEAHPEVGATLIYSASSPRRTAVPRAPQRHSEQDRAHTLPAHGNRARRQFVEWLCGQDWRRAAGRGRSGPGSQVLRLRTAPHDPGHGSHARRAE